MVTNITGNKPKINRVEMKYQTLEVEEPPFEGVSVGYRFGIEKLTHDFYFWRGKKGVVLVIGYSVVFNDCHKVADSIRAAYRLVLADIEYQGGYDAVAIKQVIGEPIPTRRVGQGL